MDLQRSSLVGLVVATLMPLSIGNAQRLPLRLNQVSTARQPHVDRKEAIERRFESTQPNPRPQFDGAVPGQRLLDLRRMRAVKLASRAQAGLGGHPEAAESSAVMPGIQQRPTLPAGGVPTSVATGDFNQDGHMDFIVANGADNDLWLYLGNGDGTFRLPRVIALSKGVAPVYLVTGDLRGNGKLDLVLAETDSQSVGVLLGNGDGTFGYEQIYTLPQPPSAVVIDDFNHDGKPDIAAVMQTTIDPTTQGVSDLALLTGDGTGNFNTPVTSENWGFFSTAWNIASGDVNGDGLPDVLITGPGLENSQIYLNNGDGTFRAGQIIQENSIADALLDGRLVDIDGDGCLDAVVADGNSVVWVATGDCSGNFASPKPVYMGDSNAAVRLVDVNGDGHLDIVTSSLPDINPAYGSVAGNTLSVAFGDGKGNFGLARNYIGKSQAYSLAVADFNGDGKPDFVTANNDSDTVTVYQNDGSGGFGFPQGVYAGVLGQMPPDTPTSPLSFSDLNGDGKMDAFLLERGGGETFATSFLNDGTGRFNGAIASAVGLAGWNTSGLDTTPEDYRLGDFRNTGHQDMVAVGGSVDYILFLKGNGDGTFAKGTPVTTPGAVGMLTTGDFNHDGKLDFVAVGDGALTAFLGNGDGTFTAGKPTSFTDGANWPYRAYTGDFNRDGKLDVLVFMWGNVYPINVPDLWEFDGNGDGTFQAGRQLFANFQPFVLADLNNDGHPDLAQFYSTWGNSTAQFNNYLGQADGSFQQSSSYAPYVGLPKDTYAFDYNGDPAASSLAADYSGDGKMDEAALQSQNGENYVQFLMGNGDGTFTPTYDVFPFYQYVYPLYAYDLDGDGKADMVQVVYTTASLQVYKGAAAPALQIELNDPVVKGNASCGWVFPNVASSSSTTVALASSISGVVLPASVTVAANATSAQFCYTLASNFNWQQVFDVKAQLNGDTATAYATESYTFGFSVGLSAETPTVMYGGQSTNPVTVTVTSSQGYSSTAKLYCEGMAVGDSCQFSASTINITPVGPATATVQFVTAANAAANGNSHPFTVVVDDGNVIHRQTETVGVSSLNLINLPAQMVATSPGSVSAQVSIFGIPPFALSCSGLPAGATCSTPGSQLPYPSTSAVTLMINVPSGVALGSYPVTVTLTSGQVSTSVTTALQLMAFNVQGPPASSDWALPGGQQSVPITASANLAASGNMLVSCSLDVGGVCSGDYVAVSPTPQNVSLAVLVPSSATAGQHVLTVTTTYETITQSFALPFYVADFSGTLSGSTASLTRSANTTITATLSATTDFSDQVALACSGTEQVTCSFSPVTVQLTAGTPQTVNVTMSAGSTASAPVPPTLFFNGELIAFAGLLPLGICLRRRRWATLLLFVAGFVLLLPLGSCGSGGGSGGGGGIGGGGESNSYSVTVTASVPTTSLTRTLGTVNVTVSH